MWTTPSSAHASPSPSVQAFLYALAASGRAGDRRSHARTAGALDAGAVAVGVQHPGQALGGVVADSPRPWLHIAQEVATVAAARGYRRVGILGTHWLVDSDVYPEAFAARGLEYARPGQDDRRLLGSTIMDELVYGVFEPASVSRLQGIVQRMKDDGCDAVVLGCTELPLVLNDGNCALPTLDSTRLLARAALDHALGGLAA